MSDLKVTTEVTVTLNSSLYELTDAEGNDVISFVTYFNVDSDNDVIINLDGYVIDEEEHILLEKARSLTNEDWDLIATVNLINS